MWFKPTDTVYRPRDPFRDLGPHLHLMVVHFKNMLIVSTLDYKSSDFSSLESYLIPLQLLFLNFNRYPFLA